MSPAEAELGFQGMDLVRPATTTSQGYEFPARMDTPPGTRVLSGNVARELGSFLISRFVERPDEIILYS